MIQMTEQQTKLMERAKDIGQNIGVAECGYREDGFPAADCHALLQHGEQAERAKIKAYVWKTSTRRAACALQIYVRRLRKIVIEMLWNIL